MSDHLPDGWEFRAIGDLCGPKVSQADPGDHAVPYIDIGSIDRRLKAIGDTQLVDRETAPTRARQWILQGDVLVSLTRPNLNAVALVPPHLEGAVASTGFDVLRAKDVLPQWLFARVQTREFVADVCKGLQGVVYPAIRPRDVRRHLMPVPSKAVQEDIVAAIDTHLSRLDAATATLERSHRNLKRYRASVLKAAVEGRLVPTEAALARAEGREYEPATALLDRILSERRTRWIASGKKGKYKEPAAPDTRDLPELPEGWCWASLEQLGELGRGKSKHRPRNDPRLLGGPYPFIQTGDVVGSDGRITTWSATYSEFGLAQSRLWPADTLCITIAASIAATGLLGFPACFPDSVVGLELAGPRVIAEYVEYFMRTARGDLDRYAPATAQKNINLEILHQVVVPLPSGPELQRIVDELSRLLTIAAAAEATIDANLARIRGLRSAILSAAFRGELV